MLNASHYHLFDFIINAYFSTRAHNFRCASIITEHCIAPFQQLQHAKNFNIWSTYEAYKSHSFFHLKIYFFHFHARMVCIPAVVYQTHAHTILCNINRIEIFLTWFFSFLSFSISHFNAGFFFLFRLKTISIYSFILNFSHLPCFRPNKIIIPYYLFHKDCIFL